MTGVGIILSLFYRPVYYRINSFSAIHVYIDLLDLVKSTRILVVTTHTLA